jgi:hypothetical protein
MKTTLSALLVTIVLSVPSAQAGPKILSPPTGATIINPVFIYFVSDCDGKPHKGVWGFREDQMDQFFGPTEMLTYSDIRTLPMGYTQVRVRTDCGETKVEFTVR